MTGYWCYMLWLGFLCLQRLQSHRKKGVFSSQSHAYSGAPFPGGPGGHWPPPLAEQEINLKKGASKTNSSLRSSIGPKKKFITYGEVAPRKFVYKVSCLFTKYLLTYGFLTVNDIEKLCQPMRRASKAHHSIS